MYKLQQQRYNQQLKTTADQKQGSKSNNLEEEFEQELPKKISYLFCEKINHEMNQLNMACLNPDCKLKGLICCMCLEEHTSHLRQCIALQKIIGQLSADAEITSSQEEKQKQHDQYVCYVNNEFSRIVYKHLLRQPNISLYQRTRGKLIYQMIIEAYCIFCGQFWCTQINDQKRNKQRMLKELLDMLEIHTIKAKQLQKNKSNELRSQIDAFLMNLDVFQNEGLIVQFKEDDSNQEDEYKVGQSVEKERLAIGVVFMNLTNIIRKSFMIKKQELIGIQVVSFQEQDEQQGSSESQERYSSSSSSKRKESKIEFKDTYKQQKREDITQSQQILLNSFKGKQHQISEHNTPECQLFSPSQKEDLVQSSKIKHSLDVRMECDDERIGDSEVNSLSNANNLFLASQHTNNLLETPKNKKSQKSKVQDSPINKIHYTYQEDKAEANRQLFKERNEEEEEAQVLADDYKMQVEFYEQNQQKNGLKNESNRDKVEQYNFFKEKQVQQNVDMNPKVYTPMKNMSSPFKNKNNSGNKSNHISPTSSSKNSYSQPEIMTFQGGKIQNSQQGEIIQQEQGNKNNQNNLSRSNCSYITESPTFIRTAITSATTSPKQSSSFKPRLPSSVTKNIVPEQSIVPLQNSSSATPIFQERNFSQTQKDSPIQPPSSPLAINRTESSSVSKSSNKSSRKNSPPLPTNSRSQSLSESISFSPSRNCSVQKQKQKKVLQPFSKLESPEDKSLIPNNSRDRERTNESKSNTIASEQEEKREGSGISDSLNSSYQQSTKGRKMKRSKIFNQSKVNEGNESKDQQIN